MWKLQNVCIIPVSSNVCSGFPFSGSSICFSLAQISANGLAWWFGFMGSLLKGSVRIPKHQSKPPRIYHSLSCLFGVVRCFLLKINFWEVLKMWKMCWSKPRKAKENGEKTRPQARSFLGALKAVKANQKDMPKIEEKAADDQVFSEGKIHRYTPAKLTWQWKVTIF